MGQGCSCMGMEMPAVGTKTGQALAGPSPLLCPLLGCARFHWKKKHLTTFESGLDQSSKTLV